MKRLIRLAAIVFAFVSCVTACLQSQPPLPYCEVARNGEQYHNKIIRVRAKIGLTPEAIYIYQDCDPVEALGSLVDVSNVVENDTNSESNQLLVPAQHSIKMVDAIVEGRFDAKFSMGCWGPKYRITASRVDLLGPVSDGTFPPIYHEEGLRIKH
jgi:hypothetical protein